MHGKTKYNNADKNLSYVNPTAPKGGALKIAKIGTFDTLNPYSIKGQAAASMNLVYDRLMRRVWDEPFTMYPLIAEHIEIPHDRSSITFHINPKARFHDHSAITTQDVLYSYETLKEYGRPNMRSIYKLVSSVDVINTRQIRFNLGEGYDRETVMILAMMPILSKAWWSNHNFDSTISETPLLNGPYRIKESKISKKISYVRVPDYWAKDLFVNIGHYNFDTVTYEYYRDDTIALESFKKGDLNLRREWDVTKWQKAYDDISREQIRLSVPHKRPERAHGFIFNMRHAPFDNLNIRKALYLAFDYDWVEKNLFHNEFKRVESFYPNSILAAPDITTDAEKALLAAWKDKVQSAVLKRKGADFFPSIIVRSGMKPPTMRLKLMQAGQFLQGEGWVIENGKRVHNKTKQPLTFEIILSTSQEQKIAVTYQRSLERLGIEMKIRMLDSATFQKRKSTYDYDMISFYWQNSLSPGTEQMLYWSCKAANEPARFNFSGICNPALDHFASQIANAKTYDDLTHYAHIIDRILLSEYVSIPLFYKGVDYIAHHKDIQRPEETPTYGAVTETWWIKPIQ